MFCTNCGSQIPERSQFCSNCGTNIAAANGYKQEPQKIIIQHSTKRGNDASSGFGRTFGETLGKNFGCLVWGIFVIILIIIIIAVISS